MGNELKRNKFKNQNNREKRAYLSFFHKRGIEPPRVSTTHVCVPQELIEVRASQRCNFTDASHNGKPLGYMRPA